ncbi:glycosyltransferase family 2 protein [Thiorhodococcus mannitoliphagus]|uniref:Glycosyltransferase family 2 protein n=1 Tax=Thiorhodococcus mannitoliphagus TaxID=329406 RepID=A0A6P1E4P3_9GAMM|nr:glycosyltransferase family 2 protein [Thiorhodococcus mannitoliphagus]NEX22615.1 glycosyltransferase family 2 protein [Thiorhodococcus mannitoliphagus]
MNEKSDAPTVAVLIPYFQKQKGILENTVRSVLAQRGFDDYKVIIVDDGSPVSAESELVSIVSHREKIRIIQQKNAGPGAARNKALENVPDGTGYVAFLDSDDQLDPSYLADAVSALDKGYDLFFGNSRRAGIEKSRFEWDSIPGVTLDLTQHRLIDEAHELYEFVGDFFDFVVFRSNIIGPSTMAYRYRVGSNVRFNEKIYNGQDRIFKLFLCRQAKKVAFSPKEYAREGKGINIFDSAGWGTERSLSLLSSYIEMCKFILNNIPMNARQLAHVKRHLAQTRYAFTASLFHQTRHGTVDWKLVGKTFVSDSATLLWLVPNAMKVVKVKSRADRS